MSRTYARCRICGRPKSQVNLSSRGKCAACAMGNIMAASAASVAAIQMANEPKAQVIPLRSAFESLDEQRST